MIRIAGLLVVAALLLVQPVWAEDEVATKALYDLFSKERDFHYQDNPGSGPRGSKRPGPTVHKDVSPAAQTVRKGQYETFLAELNGIDKAELTRGDQINHDLFRYYLNRQLIFLTHRTWRLPLQSDSGFHTWVTRRWRGYALRTEDDLNRYITWLKGVPGYLAMHQANLQLGLDEGFTMPKVVLDGLLQSFRAVVKGGAEATPFARELKRAEVLPGSVFKPLRAEAINVIANQIVPAYEALADYMEGPYYQGASDAIAVTSMPGGDAYYADAVKFYTTLDITPDEVHEIGLKEVARIRAEMEQVMADADFDGTFAEFIDFLRTDPQFYATSADQLIKEASWLAKQIDAQMPKFFGTLPRQSYGVEPVPASIAPNYTTGRYVGAPIGSDKGGTYWVNTFALDKRPLYNLPSLTLHEAVPGHHHQSALSKEIENVPEFRLGLYPHAYGEGWGLYSEKLGIEMGMYKTPYQQFGRLSYEMWRAARLVVDTGMHSKGWSRADAIKLMEENSALSKLNIRTEVDRYIGWPGQALAYKMGELTILRLRAKAEEALGDQFDIKTFHDTILTDGGMPLTMLEAKVDGWIATLLPAGD